MLRVKIRAYQQRALDDEAHLISMWFFFFFSVCGRGDGTRYIQAHRQHGPDILTDEQRTQRSSEFEGMRLSVIHIIIARMSSWYFNGRHEVTEWVEVDCMTITTTAHWFWEALEGHMTSNSAYLKINQDDL